MNSLFAKTDKSVFFPQKTHFMCHVFIVLLVSCLFQLFFKIVCSLIEINWNAEWKNMTSDLFLQINSSYKVTHDEE